MRYSLLHKESLRSISSLVMGCFCIVVDAHYPYLEQIHMKDVIVWIMAIEMLFIVAIILMPTLFDQPQPSEDKKVG